MYYMQVKLAKEEFGKILPPLNEESANSPSDYHLYWVLSAILHNDISIDTSVLDAVEFLKRREQNK